MNADGISPRRIMAAHLEPAYEGHQHVGLPVTEWLTRNSLILPLYDTMTGNDQERVVAVLSRLAETAGRPGLANITAAGELLMTAIDGPARFPWSTWGCNTPGSRTRYALGSTVSSRQRRSFSARKPSVSRGSSPTTAASPIASASATAPMPSSLHCAPMALAPATK